MSKVCLYYLACFLSFLLIIIVFNKRNPSLPLPHNLKLGKVLETCGPGLYNWSSGGPGGLGDPCGYLSQGGEAAGWVRAVTGWSPGLWFSRAASHVSFSHSSCGEIYLDTQGFHIRATYLIQLLNDMLEQTLEELMGFAQENIARVRYVRDQQDKTWGSLLHLLSLLRLSSFWENLFLFCFFPFFPLQAL